MKPQTKTYKHVIDLYFEKCATQHPHIQRSWQYINLH